jgi:hypothetical protein
VFQLDNGINTGIGYHFVFPAGMTCIVTEVVYRSSVIPDLADRTLLFQIRFRIIPDGAAINSWQLKNFAVVVPIQDVNFHKIAWVTNVGVGAFDDKLVQFQFVRKSTDTLPNPIYIERIHFKFS